MADFLYTSLSSSSSVVSLNPDVYRYFSLLIGATRTFNFSKDAILYILSIILDMSLLNKLSLFFNLKTDL